MRQKVLIEVALCERCGRESFWSQARRAGLPICQKCGSADISRCEREQTPVELASIIGTLNARRQPTFDYRNQAWTGIVGGRRVYLRCGHPESMDCGCFGRIHAGEEVCE